MDFILRQRSASLIATLAFVGAGYSVSTHAADAVGAASANVMMPVVIENIYPIDFGIFAGGTGGQITISTDGSRSKSGGVFIAPSGSKAAQFRVYGEANATFSVDVQEEPTTISSGSYSMTLSDLNTSLATSGNQGTFSALPGMFTEFRIGGTLTVEANQQFGSYNGYFNLNVNYN